MKEFKIKMEWLEKHEGFIAVKANSKEEALGILESEKRKYTAISKNCYHNSSSISIENITVENEFPIAERIKDIEFCTVWDGGDVYSSPAKLNLNTGEVFDIEPVSDDIAQSVTTYEGSYILVDSIKQSVYRVKDTDKYVTAKFI